MKKNILVLLLALFPIFLSAGVESDTVNYTLLRNDPNRSFFGLGAGYDVSINKYNLTLAAVGGSAMFCTPRLFFNFAGRFHFGENLGDDWGGNPYIRSVYIAENSRDISADLTYYYSNEIKRGNRTIRLKKVGNVVYVAEIPCDFGTRFGIDLGFTSGVTYYNFQENAVVVGIDESSNVVDLLPYNEKTVSTYYRYNYLKVGASRTIVDNVTIQTDRFGKKGMNGISKIYAHVFIGFGGNLDDVYKPYDFAEWNGEPIGPYTRYELNTSNRISPIGGCIGWYAYNVNKMGIGVGAELGLLPGPTSHILNNTYLDFKLKFHFARYI